MLGQGPRARRPQDALLGVLRALPRRPHRRAAARRRRQLPVRQLHARPSPRWARSAATAASARSCRTRSRRGCSSSRTRSSRAADDGATRRVALPPRPASRLPPPVAPGVLSAYDFIKYFFTAIVPKVTLLDVSAEALLDGHAEAVAMRPAPPPAAQARSRKPPKTASMVKGGKKGKRALQLDEHWDLSADPRQMLAVIQSATFDDWEKMLLEPVPLPPDKAADKARTRRRPRTRPTRLTPTGRPRRTSPRPVQGGGGG